jgi:hypothetical protein
MAKMCFRGALLKMKTAKTLVVYGLVIAIMFSGCPKPEDSDVVEDAAKKCVTSLNLTA